MSESRRPILQLSPSLVNRIAAGEVIERPSSVVKELVENAIDAGASEIIVEIEDGGRELIRVIDNGGGISPADLKLAFASHATSKLACDEDLFQITTMGFRGEALASIGAVSHARILSRTSNSDAAYEIHNRGGAISDAQAAAGNVGTTIEVRNLFFNVPARRKFLKGAGTEFGHISDMILRLALPHPKISFKLLHGGRVALEFSASSELDRLLCAWPDEFHEQRLPLEVRDAELQLHGIIGLPELARPTPKYQHIYLNGRPIRDKFIQHAIRESYRGLTEPGRYPAAVLLLEVPPQDVDVNVHPTKNEVRFRDSGRIHGLVMASLREKLLGSDLSPTAVPMRSDADDRAREDMAEKLAAFFKGSLAGKTGSAGASPSHASPSPLAGEGGGEGRSPLTQHTPFTLTAPQIQPRFEYQRGEGEAPAEPNSPRALGSAGASPSHAYLPLRSGENRGERAHEISIPAISEFPPHPIPLPRGESGQIPAIQLHNSYLVAQSDDGMIIIDQHALHERIMFEDLMARVMRGPLESQRLLIPQTVPASSRQIALLDHIQPLLARLGIEITSFGPDSVAVQSFPSFLEKLEPSDFVRELLERGEQELLDLHEEELLHEVLDMMACKAAVKAGDPLTPGEIEALLARRDLVERSSNCPHGRPTTLRLTLKDLEKQFKRTGF